MLTMAIGMELEAKIVYTNTLKKGNNCIGLKKINKIKTLLH